MITLANVTKRYNSFVAVNDISLSIPTGSIFAFLGVNGAGKTTTIRMITGLIAPSSGSIHIGGFNLATQPNEAKSLVGYVPDRPYIYPKLTGREFLHFICDLYKVPTRISDERIDSALSEFAMSQWQNNLVESYSHGMRQRLSMCAALVHQPQILILDEPMVGLDPHGAYALKASLRRYASLGMTVLLSTHSLNVAEEIADHLAIIHKGSILTVGTLDDLREATERRSDGLEEMFLELTAMRYEH